MPDRMSDLELFLTVVVLGASVYTMTTLRWASRRLHYRDRSLFWRGAALLLAGVGAALACLTAALLTAAGPWVLYLGCLTGAVTAALAWWVDLEPGRVVQAVQSRRHPSR